MRHMSNPTDYGKVKYIRFPQSLERRLEADAKREDITFAALVRRIVRKHYKTLAISAADTLASTSNEVHPN